MSKLTQMKQRPATHSMTARINAKYLATLIVFWKSKGIEGNSASELVRLSLETFTEFLTTNNAAIMVTSTADALDIIKKCGYKIGRISTKAIVDELTKEDGISMEFLNATETINTMTATPKKVSATDLEIAQALMKKEEEKELQERIKASQDNTSNTLKNLG